MRKYLIIAFITFGANIMNAQYIHDLFPCRDSSGARVEGCFALSDSQGQYIQVTDTSFCLTDTLIVHYRTVNNAWGYNVGEIVMRDTLLGQCGQTQSALDSIHGWAQYTDTLYTTSNRLSVSEGDTVTLPNNAGSTITSHLPLGVTSFYNTTDTLITPDRSGDSYNIRVDFTASSSSNDGYFTLVLDIGGSQGIILSSIKTFPKGSSTEHGFSYTSGIYTLDTFIDNGGKLKIIGGTGTTEIWDINMVIIRTSRARN